MPRRKSRPQRRRQAEQPLLPLVGRCSVSSRAHESDARHSVATSTPGARALRWAALFAVSAVLAAQAPTDFEPSPHYTIPTDTVLGGAGDDVLKGSGGDDLLRGHAGEDWLSGEDGSDRMDGGEGRDILDGGPGSDDLTGGDGDDILVGDDGNDVLEGGPGADQLRGGAGDDGLFGDEGDDILGGGDGEDVLDGGAGADVLHGGVGHDVLDGGEGDDVLNGGEGDDTLDGNDGDDQLHGGPGRDDLDGGDGIDHLIGGEGDDTLAGHDGSDILQGGNGADLLLGGDQADLLLGGAGDDSLGGQGGADVLKGEVGDDLMSGGRGPDVLVGGSGDDTLLGGEDDDQLLGGSERDVLRGNDGEDVLDGGPDDDRLVGGAGADHMRGGDGADVLVLRAGDVDRDRTETVEGGGGTDVLLLNGFSPSDIVSAETLLLRTGTDTLSEESMELKLLDPLTGGTYLVSGVEKIEYAHLFAGVGAGAVPSHLILTNPSASETSQATVEVRSEGGGWVLTSDDGRDGTDRLDIAVPPMGTVDLTMIGPSDRAGGLLEVRADRPLAGVVTTSVDAYGTAGVAEGLWGDEFLVPASLDRRGGWATGFTVASGGSETALRVQLLRDEGGEPPETSVLVPALEHRTLLLDELFPQFDDWSGLLRVEGDQLIGSAVSVGVDGVELGTGPVIPIDRPSRGETLFFPHVGEAGEVSVISLVNTCARQEGARCVSETEMRATGMLSFFDDDGAALDVEIEGLGSVTEVPFAIGPAGSAVFRVRAGAEPFSGSARAVATGGSVGGSMRLSFEPSLAVEVEPSRAHQTFIAAVRRSEADGVNTMIALHNVGTTSTVALTLRDENGNEVTGGSTRVRLRADGHVATRLETLFPEAVTEDFRGTLTGTVQGSTAAVSVILLDSRSGRATAMPVKQVY